MTTVADQFAETLAIAGIKRIYGIVGDSLNGLTDAIRRQGKIEWIHVRHEEVAAFAAGAEAHLTGDLAVCAGSCGPGNLHLINGLFDCHRSRVPVLAIAAHIPSAEIGTRLFPGNAPADAVQGVQPLLRARLRRQPDAARARRSRSARRSASAASRWWSCPATSHCSAAEAPPPQRGGLCCRPRRSSRRRRPISIGSRRCSTATSRVTILCGSGCQGAHDELLALGERLKAPMVHALRGKEHVEWDNPYDVGMTGLIGFSSGYYAMLDCDVLLMLGTDFPYRQFYPQGNGVRIAQVDIRAENIGRRAAVDLGLVGDVRATLARAAAAAEGEARRRASRASAASTTPRRARRSTISPPARPASRRSIRSRWPRRSAMQAADDAIFTCDVGLPTVWAARYLAMNGKRRLIGSFWHGSMANAMAQAIGAQAAFPGRQVVSLSRRRRLRHADGRFPHAHPTRACR